MGEDSGSRRALVVATSNRGKLEELRSMLAGLPVAVCAVRDVVRQPPLVVEDGATFADNAIKKALAAAQATGMLALADDSGLEVDLLGGQPGVRSARFAHEQATDAENTAALLAALGDAGHAPPWHARFRCVLALVDPQSNPPKPWTVEGVCEGTIAAAPRGSGGFGYDPIFVIAKTDRTMAELGPGEKNRVSHRARAVALLKPLLARLLAETGG
jgi:XTP/dITP diphosphohydrolase